MLTDLQEVPVNCPYCGEPVTLLVDESVPEQRYYEDCAVCCRPILVSLRVDAEGGASVDLAREDD